MISVIHLRMLFVGTCFSFLAGCGFPYDKSLVGNCTDGIQNQSEEGVDCGGPCTACASCDDGIQNNGETGIDCGGPCLSCIPSCSITQNKLQGVLHSVVNSGIAFDVDQPVLYTNYISSSNLIDVNLDNTAFYYLSGMTLSFYKVNPFNYTEVGKTAVYTTTTTNATYDKAGQVYVRYYKQNYYGNFEGILGNNQKVFVNRSSATDLQITFCNLVGGNNKDTLSLSCIAN